MSGNSLGDSNQLEYGMDGERKRWMEREKDLLLGRLRSSVGLQSGFFERKTFRGADQIPSGFD